MTDSNTGEPNGPPGCSQCGRPAVYTLGGVPVCIDCNYKHQQSQWLQFAQHAAMINHLDREMAMSVGMPHLANPIAIPRPPVPPLHYNNQSVSVSGGSVGAINFGNLKDIQVSIKAITEGGHEEVAKALADLANAVLNASEANEHQKNEILEQIAVVSKEAEVPPDKRKAGVVKAILNGIKDTAGVVSSVGTAWQTAEPILKTFFGV